MVRVREPRGAAEHLHRKQYEEELDLVPDYRITCVFVDRRYRRKGLSAVALQGALDLISEARGGSAISPTATTASG